MLSPNNRLRFGFFLIAFFVIVILHAQKAKVSGRILDESNHPVIGATIIFQPSKVKVQSDIDGYFVATLNIGKYNITITSVGFGTKNLNDFEVKLRGNDDLLVVLQTKSDNLENVTVKSSSARKETVNALIQFQKNTNTVASVISAEAIRRSPDRNTGEVLRRTPGVSLLDGKFLVVRGLADRYNQAMLNGILLTSTEPDRKTFSFDIFPAQMLDNIIINKAFVPEMPGEWAGGLIQVNTKDIPNKNFFNIQIGTGANAQSFGKDFY